MRARVLARIEVDFSEDIEVVRLSPGGTRLAVAENRGEGKEVLVVEVPSGKEVARYPGLGGVEDMAFRSENALLVIHGADCWLCDVGKKTHTVIREGQVREGGPLYCLSQSPDGKTLALGANRALLLWDVRRKRLRRSLMNPAGGWACGASFSADGRYVAGVCPPGDYLDRMMCFVGVWDVASGERVRLLKLYDRGCAAFRPDNRVLAVGWGYGFLLYDLREPKPPRVNVDELFTRDFVYAMGWTEPLAYHPVSDDVRSLRFSADGKTVSAWGYEGSAIRLNVRTGRILSHTKAPADHVEVGAVTINGSGLAAAKVGDKSILVWRVPRWGA